MLELFTFLHKYWNVICVLGGLMGGAFLLFMESRFAKKSDLADLRQKVDKVANEQIKIQDEMKHLPTKQDVITLIQSLNEVKVELSGVSAEVNAMRYQVHLLLENELGEHKE